MTRQPFATATALALALAGCNAVFGVDDLTFVEAVGGAAATGGAGGTGPTTSSSGGGGSGTGGSASGGGGAGGGLPPPTLIDEGLVVRYFVDEAAMGQDPPALLDAGPEPAFDLMLVYGTASWFEDPTGRGLRFPQDHSSIALAPTVVGTKIRDLLDGSPTATVEIVLEALPNAASPGEVIFMYKEDGAGDGLLGLGAIGGRPYFEWSSDTPSINDATQVWDTDLGSLGRVVAHAVVDTNAQQPVDRVRLFIDGLPVTPDPMPGLEIALPTLGEGLDTCGASCQLLVGNATNNERAFAGDVSYAAIYSIAFTEAQIASNVAQLTANDDAPSP